VSGLQPVHVRVTDAATGKPTPCRVRFADAEGKYYAPYGRLTEFATGPGNDVGGNLQAHELDADGRIVRKNFAYIDGGCEIALPPGRIDVAICKGPEFTPIQDSINLLAGKLALRFELRRWSDIRQQRWIPGDSGCHFLSPHAALLDGAGEDLSIVNLLVCGKAIKDEQGWFDDPATQWSYPNMLAFSGQQPAVSHQDCMVVVNTLNTHPTLGWLALLNCHRVVFPLGFGRRRTEADFDDWTLADWCDQCHRKRGLVVWANANQPKCGELYGEALAELILGKVDAIEAANFSVFDENPWKIDWYGLLNCGLHVPLAGGSGKLDNVVPLGCVRTYARLLPDQLPSYQNWIEAIRAGRTFATNGPLLSFSVEGQDPGATINVSNHRPIRILADARSTTPFEVLEIVVNGTVAAQQSASGTPSTAHLEAEINMPEGGWVAARCRGKAWVQGYFGGQRIYAHTSPVYIRVAGQRPHVDQTALRSFLNHLHRMAGWVDTQGRFENDAQRQRLRKVFEDAIEVLNKRAD